MHFQDTNRGYLDGPNLCLDRYVDDERIVACILTYDWLEELFFVSGEREREVAQERCIRIHVTLDDL